MSFHRLVRAGTTVALLILCMAGLFWALSHMPLWVSIGTCVVALAFTFWWAWQE